MERSWGKPETGLRGYMMRVVQEGVPGECQGEEWQVALSPTVTILRTDLRILWFTGTTGCYLELMLKPTHPWLLNVLPLGIPSSHFLPDSILSGLPQCSFCPPSVLVLVLHP